MAHDVFISYASSDKAVADAVCSQLESLHRIRCWIAPRDVTPGASWAESIIDALDESKIMVLIFSSNANASMQIEREVERAVHKGINIIPLRIENTIPTKTLEYFISAPHWLDALSVPLENHIEKLAASVKALLARHVAAAPSRPTEPVVSTPPAAAPRPAAPVSKPVSAEAKSKGRFAVPAVIVALLVVGAIATKLRTTPQADPASAPDAAAAASSAAAPTSPVAGTPSPSTTSSAPTAAAEPPAASTSVAPSAAQAGATAVPSSPATAATDAAGAGAASGTSPARSAGSSAASANAKTSPKGPNLLIELADNLPEGSLKLEVDGVVKWTPKLDDSAKAGSLTLPTGPHQVGVTLLGPKGEIKETKTTSISGDAEIVRTLKVRLSRFRRNLELEVVVTPAKTDGRGAATPATAGGARSGDKGPETKAPTSRP
jgi:hypothetical protein